MSNLDISFGINQGYPTFGLKLAFKIITIEFAQYTQELGKYPGDIPSVRYSSKVSLGWLL